MNQKFIFAILLTMLLAPLDMEAKAAIKREQSDVGINSAEREQARPKIKKKVKKGQEVPQLLNYPSAELSEYRLHGGNFVIKGRFILPDPQLIK